MVVLRCLTIAGLVVILSSPGVQAGTLEEVRSRGHLNCGINRDLPGFSFEEADGRWAGLDVDTCRAIAAATLGDADKVVYIAPLPKDRFAALQSGEIDVLAQNTTWTLSRDAGLELDFAGITYYDGQGFMVREDFGLATATELDGATICVTRGTTTELNLTNFFAANDMELRTISFDRQADTAAAYELGKCDAVTSDRSALAAFRSQFEDPQAHAILPDVISKEPLGPVVRHRDNKWFDIVKWTVFALVQAEESGVTSQNVDEMTASNDPTIQRLLGISGDMGRQLGVPGDWAYQVISQVGNYGEVYKRNLGPETAIGLKRGVNAQWQDGGLLYAMPFR